MKKVLFVLLLLFTFIKVDAYENDYFNIDIPNNYKLSSENNGIYKWDKDNNYIAITISDNSSAKYNIKYFSDEEIKNQKYYIEQSINSKLSDYNIKANITSIDKYNIDDIYYLEYDLYLPSKKLVGYNMYQKGRVYSTNKYLFTIIYNSDKEITNDKNYDSLMNSFKVKDITIDQNIMYYIIAAIIIGTASGIIGYFVTSKKKRNK